MLKTILKSVYKKKNKLKKYFQQSVFAERAYFKEFIINSII